VKKVFIGYTKYKWQNCCSHVKKIQEKHRRQDGLMHKAVGSMITQLGDNSGHASPDEERWRSSKEE
jgi:hypothetical protein